MGMGGGTSETFYALTSGSPGYYTWANWGVSTDQAVAGDFNADGKADWAIFRPNEGCFYIWYKDTQYSYSVGGFEYGDIPVVRDYDGDWASDPATFRPENSTWNIQYGSGGGSATQWGAFGDIPVERMPQ